MAQFISGGCRQAEPSPAGTTPGRTSMLGRAQGHCKLDICEHTTSISSQSASVLHECDNMIRPSIIFTKEGFVFIDGIRVPHEEIASWLGHDALDDPTEPVLQEIESVPTVFNDLIFDREEVGSTVTIGVPLGTTRCTDCSELFVSHGCLDKHLNEKHPETFRTYKCNACGKHHPRYKPATIHHALCLRKKSRAVSTQKETVMELTEGTEGQAGEVAADPVAPDNLAEEIITPVVSEPAPTTSNTLAGKETTGVESGTVSWIKCEACDQTFSSRIGVSQHERHAHPDLRNSKRIGARMKDIERKRLARKVASEAKPEPAGKAKSSRSNWSDEEIETLVRLNHELRGTRNINVAIAKLMPSKTNKQIGDKRRLLNLIEGKSKAPKQASVDRMPVPDPEIPPPLELGELFRANICSNGKTELIGLSGDILRKALDGENTDTQQTELIQLLMEKCSEAAEPKVPKPTRSPQEASNGGKRRGRRSGKRAEYRRVQQLFDTNRKKLASEILDNKSETAKCDIDPKVVQATYTERFGGVSQEVDLTRYPSAKPVDNFMLMKPITVEEVQRAISASKRDSATGPDGVSLSALKDLDNTARLLTNIFNIWWYSKKVPEVVKQNRSILLPKGTENLHDINNWRPLTISSVILRLYTKVLARRATQHIHLNPRQRGFIDAPGCSENQLLLQRIIKQAKRNRKSLCVVLLDLAKAFDTVSHRHIQAGLERFGVGQHFVQVVRDLYHNASTHFELANGKTEDIRITRGVKQGDPLSPVLFNIAMDPLLEAISTAKNGYRWDDSGLQLEALCYADDNALLTHSPSEMQRNLETVQQFCGDTGMQLNVKKSTGFSIKPGANRSYVINDFEPKWEVDGQVLPLMNPSEGAKYLGVKVSAWVGTIRDDPLTKLELWCERLGKSMLKPRQKVQMLNQYALSRISFYLSQVDFPQSKLIELDRTIRRHVRKWLHLPECTTDHLLYSAGEKGGLGLPRLSLSAPCSRINAKRAVLRSSDESTRAFARFDGVDQEVDEVATQLGIRLPKNPKKSATWRDIEVRNWRKLRVAGRGQRVFCNQASNTWLRPTQNYFRESDFVTGLQVRADTYPTRAALARAGGSQDVMCRRCKAAPETIGHISGQCPATKGYRINRHNGIVESVADKLKTAGWTVSKEPRIIDAAGKTFIPDIIAVKGKEAVVIDPTVVYENNDNSLQSANQAKTNKYRHLEGEIKSRFGAESVTFHGLAVGARGGWTSQNEKLLTKMGICDKGFYGLLCRYALRGTLNILRIFNDNRCLRKTTA